MCSTMRSSKPSKRAERSVSSLLAGELLHELLVELPTLRRERDDPPAAGVAVDRLERGVHDVHAEHHARAAAVGLVVDLAAARAA